MFNQGVKTISTPTVHRELKEMAMKCCVTTRMCIATFFVHPVYLVVDIDKNGVMKSEMKHRVNERNLAVS
jgi:hypothetical protein